MSYHPTLNAALESVGLLHTWECIWPGIAYGETRRYIHADKLLVSIYRDERGYYETPVHYSTR